MTSSSIVPRFRYSFGPIKKVISNNGSGLSNIHEHEVVTRIITHEQNGPSVIAVFEHSQSNHSAIDELSGSAGQLFPDLKNEINGLSNMISLIYNADRYHPRELQGILGDNLPDRISWASHHQVPYYRDKHFPKISHSALISYIRLGRVNEHVLAAIHESAAYGLTYFEKVQQLILEESLLGRVPRGHLVRLVDSMARAQVLA